MYQRDFYFYMAGEIFMMAGQIQFCQDTMAGVNACTEDECKGGFTIYTGPCVVMRCVESARHDARIEPRSILVFFRIALRFDIVQCSQLRNAL